MKLLFALSGFHRVHRGAEVALLSVARELGKSGISVTVAGGGKPEPDCPYEFVEVPVLDRLRFEKMPAVPGLRNAEAWEDLSFAARLAKRLGDRTFDAAITCAYPFTNWRLRQRREQVGANIFVTQNGDWPAFSKKGEFRFFECDGLICTNPDYFERNCGRYDSALIPNGLKLGSFTDIHGDVSRYGLDPELPVVLMVSALIESKRVEEGLRAVAAAKGFQLLLAGDGPLRGLIDPLGEQLLGSRYKRLTVSAAEMPALYASADAFLHMSKVESFGNVFVEALASGLPVVAHDLERTRWIVGDGEFLCDTDSHYALVAALSRAVAHGRGAQPASVQRFDWSIIAGQYLEFIESVIGKRR